VTREQVQAWLDAYVAAWRSYDADAIGALFSDAAEYRYHPYDEPLRGRQAIVDDWLRDRDEPGSWEAAYSPLLVDGDRAVATGETRYTEGRTFSNLFVIAFDGDGRCREFTEWYMEHPAGRTSAG
jgi:ketosteroid isomerase-like protein